MGSRPVVVGMLAAIAAFSTRAEARLVEPVATIRTEPAQIERAVPSSSRGLDEVARRGRTWRMATERGTVRVWVPESYNAATAATVVFVHGYRTDCDTAWADYRLPEQFALSGLNAMFVVPEAPAGKLARLEWASLDGLVAHVAANVDVAMPSGRLVAVGHSGAYRTLVPWLANTRLDTVVLLDAVYGEYRFAPWVRKSPSHRLLNIAYETSRYSDYMHRHLPTTKRVVGLPVDALPDAHIVYVKTDVGHWRLVTDGVALPMALRALDLPIVHDAPFEVPLGLATRSLDDL